MQKILNRPSWRWEWAALIIGVTMIIYGAESIVSNLKDISKLDASLDLGREIEALTLENTELRQELLDTRPEVERFREHLKQCPQNKR